MVITHRVIRGVAYCTSVGKGQVFEDEVVI